MVKISVNVFVDRQNRNIDISLGLGSTVNEMLSQLKINPVTVIVSRDNELIQEDEKLKDGDKIKILSVISGG